MQLDPKPLEPDDYRGRPVEWAGSMAGKALINAGVASALILAGVSTSWAVGVALAVGLAWEGFQYAFQNGGGKDGIRDLAFWTWGAMFPLAGAWWPVVGALAMIGGSWVRSIASHRR